MKFLKIIQVATRVGFRRLLHGPKRPSWSWRYESFIAMLREVFAHPMEGDVQKMREVLDQMGNKLLRPDLVRFTPADIAGISGLWVEPQKGEATGTVLYLHGGGYVIGSAQSHQPIMAELCQKARTRVLGINYRLAPEHPCPAAVEDVLAIYQSLRNQGQDPRRILFAGDSAGGGLALSSLVALRDQQLPLPAGAVLFSPWTDFTVSGATLEENAEYDFLQKEGILEIAGSKYYARDLGPEDPRVSPLFADLQGLPPLRIFAGEVEVLLDDSRRLEIKAKEAGVDVELHIEPDEVHAYPIFLGYSSAAETALNQTVEFIRSYIQTDIAGQDR